MLLRWEQAWFLAEQSYDLFVARKVYMNIFFKNKVKKLRQITQAKSMF